MLTLGAIAVAIMVVILLVLFDVRWRLLPLGVILIGVVWAFGLAGYLGIPLTLVTIAGLPVMLGVGIDYAIQMHARVEEEVVIDRADAPDPGDGHATSCPALLVVTFDAIFAFAALRFAKVPMIRAVRPAAGGRHRGDLPLLSIIVPLAILGIREYKSPTKGKDFREGALGRLTVKLGSLPPGVAAVPLAVASVADLLRRHRSSRASSCCRPTRSSGSTRTRRASRICDTLEDETGIVERARHLRPQSTTCSATP